MKPEQKWLQIVQAIEIIWRSGLVLNADALHYIDSTLSNPSIAELGEILSNESNCERDPLLELIFFPDESIQVRLEDLLENSQFKQKDRQQILDALVAGKLSITLRFPDGRGMLRLPVPERAAEQFIARLNISKKTDPRILQAIRRNVPLQFQRVCKVRLRNVRFQMTENKISFLCTFFENMDVDFKTVLNCFDFLLAFFDEIKDDSDLYAALMYKKQFYVGNLQKAESLDRQLRHTNMETLLMQGVKRPYFDTDDARSKIVMIDRISFSMFGKSDEFGMRYGFVDWDEFYREDG